VFDTEAAVSSAAVHFMSSLRFTLTPTVTALALALGCSGAQAYRLNPGATPEQFRIVCSQSFVSCRLEAKQLCGDEFRVVEESSNKPPAKPVESSGVSSTAPSQGVVNWRGEWVVRCGRQLPPVRLVRPVSPAAKPAPTAAAIAPAPAAIDPAPSSAQGPARVCVPGVTQACLGPGACSGAQACLPSGDGFGVCDCGTTNPSGAVGPGPSPSGAVSPNATPVAQPR
jgi:hypothetical protein